MAATFSRVKTWAAEVLTYADLNAEFDNILTNLTPSGIDDYSANTTAMRAVTDPYPGSESLATSLAGEIERIRYVLKQLGQGSQWYSDPYGYVTKTTTYTITSDDVVILGDCTSGAFTLTLPEITSSLDGKLYYVKKIDSTENALTLAAGGSDEIDVSGNTSVSFPRQNDAIILIASNTDSMWYRLSFSFVQPQWKVETKTSDHTCTLYNVFLMGDCAANDVTFTLPLAATAERGKLYMFKKIDADTNENDLIINASGSDTIDRAGVTSKSLHHQDDCVALVSDGTSMWYRWSYSEITRHCWQVYRNGEAGQGPLTASTWTKIEFDNEDFDTGGCWDMTAYRGTPIAPGKYYCFVQAACDDTGDGTYTGVAIYKNGALVKKSFQWVSAASKDPIACCQCILDMNGTTDYIEYYVQTDASSKNMLGLMSMTYAGGYRLD